MKNTADVTGGKPIAVILQSISGIRAINLLIAFYDVHGRKRKVLFFYFVPDMDLKMGLIVDQLSLMQGLDKINILNRQKSESSCLNKFLEQTTVFR
jgi:NADH:ubiquinone oxidoreductase subunit 5 (subunit L)/multisubunit Na+/H+ antiporter MnhA subunit